MAARDPFSSLENDESLRARVAALSPAKRALFERRLAASLRSEKPGTDELVAYVVSERSTADLRATLATTLPAHMVPSAVVSLDAIPRTPNGKIDLRALPAPSRVARTREDGIAPRNVVEHTVARIWERVLGVAAPGVTESFFALGGHSLLALRMLGEIEAETGRRIAVKTLFEHPTIEHLAAAVRDASSVRSLSPAVCIQDGGPEPPLFVVHPAGGDVFRYWDLARTLDARRAVWGLRSIGLEGEARPLSTIEAMASAYIAAIRGIQPEGRYHLAGWSLGGTIAFEMARQISRHGGDVALLAVLDTGADPPVESAEEMARAMPAELIGALGERFASRVTPEQLWALATLSEHDQLDAILTFARSSHVLAPSATIDDLRALLEVFRHNHIALRRYRPARDYAGRIALLRSSERDPNETDVRDPHEDETLGWRTCTTAGVDVTFVAGTHRTMLMPPNVAGLAERLRALVAQVASLRLSSSGAGRR